MTSPRPADLLVAVEAATRAPSIHNTQPWRFRLRPDGVEVWADHSRQLRLADPDGAALRVSCGAAIFNLRLALRMLGLSINTELLPEPGQPDLLARVLVSGEAPADPGEAELYSAIVRRHSNRLPFLETAVPLSLRALLIEAAEAEGAWLHMVIGAPALAMVSELAGLAGRALSADPSYGAEISLWTRPDAAHPDGVAAAAGGPSPDSGPLLTRPAPQPHLGPDFMTDPLVAVLGGSSDEPRADLASGAALQRVLLTATNHGLVASLLSHVMQVIGVREQLRIGLRRFGPPQVLIRIGFGVAGAATPRRAVSDMLLTGAAEVGLVTPV